MAVPVQSNGVSRGDEILQQRWTALDLLSDDEERRSRARAREDLEHGRRPRRVWTVVERQRNATPTGPGRDRPRQPQAGRRSGHDGREQVTDHDKMIAAVAKIVDL